MLPTLTKNHLIALIKQYKAYPDQHRDNCWRFLLALPCNEDRLNTYVQDYKLYTEKESLQTPNLILQAKNLTFTLDEMYPISNRTLKQRVEKVALALYRWSPSLAQCSWLPKFIFPFIKFYGVSTASAFETVCLLLKSNFMSNRELFIINSMIENFFTIKGQKQTSEGIKIANLMHQNNQNQCLKNLKNQQFFIFNMFSTFFTEQLEGKEWLQLMDHFFTQGRLITLYIYLAIFTAREMDLVFKLKIDQKNLNLSNINDILRCSYLILNNFSNSSNLDIYNDLCQLTGKIQTNLVLDDEFDHDFAKKQLETITVDLLPDQIIQPEMKIRDMDAEVQEVEEMFNTKYATNQQRVEMEKQRKSDQKLLDQVTSLISTQKSSKSQDSAVSSNSQIDKKKISFANDEEMLDRPVKQSKEQINENIINNQLEPPKRYQQKEFSRKADQELRADELDQEDRPMTQNEIRRSVARSQANETAQNRNELSKKLELIEQDYAERRQAHPASTVKKVKVEDDDQLQSWVPMASNRIGKSVNETLQGRLRGIRSTKQQSGLNKGSTSTNVNSSDGIVNQEDLYAENQEENDIIDEVQQPAPSPVKQQQMKQTQQIQSSNIKSKVVSTPKQQDLKTQQVKQQQQQKFPQSTAANAFKKQNPTTSKSSISQVSQPTPSIMKSSSSKNASLNSNSKLPPKTQTKPKKAQKLITNEDIMPSKQDKDLVKKLLQLHQDKLSNLSSQNSSKLTNSLVDSEEDVANSESSLIQSSKPGEISEKQLTAKEVEIKNTIKEIKQSIDSTTVPDNIKSPQIISAQTQKAKNLADQINQEINSQDSQFSPTNQKYNPSTPTQLKNQENFDSPAVNIIKVVKTTKTSKGSSQVSSQLSSQNNSFLANNGSVQTNKNTANDTTTNQNSSSNHQNSSNKPITTSNIPVENYLTHDEISQLPISNEIKKKLYDLQSQVSTSENQEIEEIASNNQNYKEIMNSNNLNVDEKIQQLVSEIKKNTLQTIDNDLKMKKIEQIQKNSEESVQLHSSDGVQNLNDYGISSMSKTTDTTLQARNEVKNLLLEKQLQEGTFGDGKQTFSDSSEMTNPYYQNQNRGGQQVSQEQLLQKQENQRQQQQQQELQQQRQNQSYNRHDDDLTEESLSQTGSKTNQSEVDYSNQNKNGQNNVKQQQQGQNQNYNQNKQNLPENSISNDNKYVYQNQLPSPEELIDQIGQAPQRSKSVSNTGFTPKQINELKQAGLSEDHISELVRQNILEQTPQVHQNSNSNYLPSTHDSSQEINPYANNISKVYQPYNTNTSYGASNNAHPENQNFQNQQQLQSQQEKPNFNNQNYNPHSQSNYQQYQNQDPHNSQFDPSQNYQNTQFNTQNQPNLDQFNQQNSQYQHPNNHFNSQKQDLYSPPANQIYSQSQLDHPSNISDSNYYQKPNFRSIQNRNDDSMISAANQPFNPINRSATSQIGESNISESSTSNFSNYLKQLQKQTKTLENRLNSSTKQSFLSSQKPPRPSGVKTSNMTDNSVFSNATSTISTVDSDPDSFNESFQVATQNVKNLKEESEGIQKGLKGLFNEVQKGLLELESQISDSME